MVEHINSEENDITNDLEDVTVDSNELNLSMTTPTLSIQTTYYNYIFDQNKK